MNFMFASDLDSTLIYSNRSLGPIVKDGKPLELVVAEFSHDKPAAFMTFNSFEYLRHIATQATFVPTTTRTRQQYERITLLDSIKKETKTPQYAIVSNGGEIIVDGKVDKDWSRTVQTRIAEGSSSFSYVREYLSQYSDANWCIKYNDVENLFVYFMLDREQFPMEVLEELRDWAYCCGWDVSLQGRKLYFTPNALTKVNAIIEVQERIGDTFLVTAGDSLLDKSMLLHADNAIRPSHGELHEEHFQFDGLRRTVNSGARGGEEVALFAYDIMLSL